MIEEQKHEHIFLAFLISLSFERNCSLCFRPKADPVMEEVLQAFAVSVKFFSPNLVLFVNLLSLKAQKGVFYEQRPGPSNTTPPCSPHPLSISRPESFPTGLLSSCRLASVTSRTGADWGDFSRDFLLLLQEFD